MCGICGHLILNREKQVDRTLLERMNATLIHRGPDSAGYYVQGNLGLAIRRLAVIDVAGGHQPMTNENGALWAVENGEIYNFRELRAGLERIGHHFATQSDTEVVLHGYEQWGDEVLQHLNGMFALALWDGEKRRLLLARDRMGKKPLYWHISPAGLIWGSEAKALLTAPWVERRVNALALHHYLTLQYTPDPLSIFEGIQQLPAGHKLVVEQEGGPQVFRWWQPSFEPKWSLTQEEVIQQARGLLGAAVERRLISEVPLGAFLSGGLDSSIVVALMAERSSRPVQTFSIGFEEKHYSETRYAAQVARRYETDHHELLFRPQDLVRLIEDVLRSADEPLADPAALPLYELARQARPFVTVALCGDGGDETLAGYQRYVLDRLLRPYAALPKWVTQSLVPSAVSLLPEPAWLPEDQNPLTGLKRLGQFSSVLPKASLVRWGSYFTHAEKLALYTDRWREEMGPCDTADWIASAYDEAPARNLLDRTLYADQMTYLAGDLLPKTDRMTMAHSLEARAPFLDRDWVEWTARLPVKYKVRGLKTKWLLQAAFADRLPPEILHRRKQGFGVPLGLWLRGKLEPWARARILGNPALKEWFRPKAMRQLFEENSSGRINHGKRLWSLLMFSLWLEQHFKG